MTHSTRIHRLTWPSARLGEAITDLAHKSGLHPKSSAAHGPPREITAEELERWVDGFARQLDVEAERLELGYASLLDSLHRRCPAVLCLQCNEETRFLCVLTSGKRSARIWGPDRAVIRIPVSAIREMLCLPIEDAQLTVPIERLWTVISPGRRARARGAYLNRALGHLVVASGWSFRLRPGADFRRQLRLAGLSRMAIHFIAAEAAMYGVWLGSWWFLGRGALTGQLSPGLFFGWALLLGVLLALRFRSRRFAGLIAIGVGGLLKRRLLDGALRLDPDAMRVQGIGHLVGRAIESQEVEALALGGGLLSVAAFVQLLAAAVVLWSAGVHVFQILLLCAWVLFTAMFAWRLFRRRREWADRRMTLTHDLVEAMVGYRTRLAQETQSRWHSEEDQATGQYIADSRAMDRTATLLSALVPRGWLVVGFAALLPLFEAPGPEARLRLAVAIGGILLAYYALKQLTAGMVSLIDGVIAWRQVKPLFDASAHADRPGVLALATARPDPRTADGRGHNDRVVIDAHDVTYRHVGRSDAILRGCDLEIRAHDRVLLQGPSGAGKSTLASLLSGLRRPDSGLLLIHGLDHASVGEHAWKRHVVLVPQFHENHVLADTFLFNLLMGRRWPPEPDDIVAARAVCHELGLGPLMSRMPAGLNQLVGNTGWQLSHGERSRLFVARALLQNPDVVIFDESFAALDPMTLSECLRCVLNRSQATLLIAHP